MNVLIALIVFLPMGFSLEPKSVGDGPIASAAVQRFEATVTAYTASHRALTASGMHPFPGVLACPRKFPFGTRFLIQGDTYVCQDRLSRKYPERFDIWKRSRAEALEFGKQRLKVAVISEAELE